MIPFDLTLETKKALLRPLTVDDYDVFLSLGKQEEEMWYYFSLNLGDEKQLQKWFEIAFADKAANTRRPFTIIDKQTGKTGAAAVLVIFPCTIFVQRSGGAGLDQISGARA